MAEPEPLGTAVDVARRVLARPGVTPQSAMRPRPNTETTNNGKGLSSKARLIWGESIPKAYRDARLIDFGDSLALDNEDWNGYFIAGKSGIGKTHFATGLAKSLFNPKVAGTICRDTSIYTEPYPDNALEWIPTLKLLCQLRSTFQPSSTVTEYDLMRRFSTCAILLIDDFGAEKTSDFTIATLCAIISERRNECRKTIVTSNMSLKQIHDMEPRLASRLAEFHTIGLPDVDRRLGKRKEGNSNE